jgi:transposase-like protein
MTAVESVDGAAVLRQLLAEGQPDVLRTMVTAFANALMSAEADSLCGAEYGQRSDERVNRRNGYRAREWDTRAGTADGVDQVVDVAYRSSTVLVV